MLLIILLIILPIPMIILPTGGLAVAQDRMAQDRIPNRIAK